MKWYTPYTGKTDHLFTVGPSAVDVNGKGLYATADIPVGMMLFGAFRLVNADQTVFEKAYEQTELNSYLNHSETPNTINYWPQKDVMFKVATTNIKRGEEITSNYQQTMHQIAKAGYRFLADWLWFKR